MEFYLNKNTISNLMKLINYIINSEEYIRCLDLKNKLKNDKKAVKLIEEIKTIQKKYVIAGYDSNIKKIIDEKKEELYNNDLYCEYNYYLNKVNCNIEIIKEELNKYFDDIIYSDLF